jgi:hypothetical protein
MEVSTSWEFHEGKGLILRELLHIDALFYSLLPFARGSRFSLSSEALCAQFVDFDTFNFREFMLASPLKLKISNCNTTN